jgi:hypothetical protein
MQVKPDILKNSKKYFYSPYSNKILYTKVTKVLEYKEYFTRIDSRWARKGCKNAGFSLLPLFSARGFSYGASVYFVVFHVYN